ncbi:Disease resistance protein RPM1 [Camellia lanceoleosa]|uniref:Disease resistance protein RPM1 n=1 Tax=Camellia lanceoleosa TaxID=1840588 RepID=A0ACC0HDU8_9ERIC|nr:Disease resistance protein RPM1 [Camellia lanceoleosa]
MKSKVDNISKGHQRYHDRYGMLEQGSRSRSTGFNKAWHDCRGDALLLNDAELVGIDERKSQLITCIKELLKGMIQQLFEEVRQPVPQGVEYMNTSNLKGIIKAFLQQKRYVLVFDDVWNIHAWQSFRYVFRIGNCGSRVVLTTRNADLASFSSKEYHGDVYNLQSLPPKESWTLSCRKTFTENSCPSYLEGLSRAISKRCEGLPLAIVAISGLYQTPK